MKPIEETFSEIQARIAETNNKAFLAFVATEEERMKKLEEERKDKDKRPWIGVDLDGTLAVYTDWKNQFHIGAPIPLMVNRIVKWVTDGIEVRILTARVSTGTPNLDMVKAAIQSWLGTHVYSKLPPNTPMFQLTSEKDWAMLELWDDRCIQVVLNTGLRADGLE